MRACKARAVLHVTSLPTQVTSHRVDARQSQVQQLRHELSCVIRADADDHGRDGGREREAVEGVPSELRDVGVV
eukprot:2757597-Pyramimonas_sp.AAC.1